MSTPPPGWYPDQANQQLVRWWDGRMWTNHTQPIQPPAAPQPQPQPQQAGGAGEPGVGPMFTDPTLQVVQNARARWCCSWAGRWS